MTKTALQIWNSLDDLDKGFFLECDIYQPLEKVRVVLHNSWEFKTPDSIVEFENKTGTLSRVSYSSRQATVELDDPHSQFGDFARCCYPQYLLANGKLIGRKNQVLYFVTDGNFGLFSRQCGVLEQLEHYPFYDDEANDLTFEQMSQKWSLVQDRFKRLEEQGLLI